jgi:membrane protein DedA with SNARE-associated domain
MQGGTRTMMPDFLVALKDWLLAAAAANAAFIVPIAFALGFAESVVLFAWMVPSSAILIGLGAIQHMMEGSIGPVWLAAAAGAFAGDIASYLFGRYFRSDIANIWPFSKQPEWIVMARVFFRKWGGLGIISSKFLGPIRAFVPVVAGAAAMRWPVFFPASAISCLAWSAAFLLPGYGFAAFLH